MLNIWFKHELNDNGTLPENIKCFFTQICAPTSEQYRHGRVLLASQLIVLFRVDPNWTETYLLPLFNWKTYPVEAKAVWEGFLWGPRIYRQLQISFKSQFLDTVHHYQELGECKRQFAAFLTYAALDPIDAYTTQDFQMAIESLPQEGLQEVARTLSQALEGAGEQREVYWKNRIQPFWQNIWPKSRELSSNEIAASLAHTCIAARGEFPTALSVFQDWLRPLDTSYFIIKTFHETNLSKRFPEDALSFLNSIFKAQQWAPDELKECLDEIAETKPALKQLPQFLRLSQHLQQYGI